MRGVSPFTTVQFLSCTSFMPHVSCNLWMTLVQDWGRGGFPIDRWCVLTHLSAASLRQYLFILHDHICTWQKISPFYLCHLRSVRYFAWGGNTQGERQMANAKPFSLARTLLKAAWRGMSLWHSWEHWRRNMISFLRAWQTRGTASRKKWNAVPHKTFL